MEGLIDRGKGDTIIDYRQAADNIVQGITEALDSQKLYHAFDAAGQGQRQSNLGKVVSNGGRVVSPSQYKDKAYQRP